MDPHLHVLFGATGDLARKKLFPALFRLAEHAGPFAVLGVGRSEGDDAQIQASAVSALEMRSWYAGTSAGTAIHGCFERTK